MKRATEKRAQPRALAALAVMSVVLAGCDEALSPDNVSADAQSSEAQADGRTDLFPIPAGSPKDDVEAPEVFQLSEPGLWDGRPSLGGIWVAHPDVTQPERVRVKNTKNNKTVTAALFRRERNLPGPELQLSSAAAEKLGILAGAPTKVDVVALRRKAPEPVEEKPATDETAAEETQTAIADEPNTDAAEIEVTETEQPEKLKWWQRKKPAAAAGGATAAAAATVAATDTATDTTAEAATEAVEAAAETEKPTKPKWWQRKKPAAATGAATAAADAATDAAAETTAEAAETVGEAEPSASLVDPEVTPPTEQPEKRKWWQKKKPDEITETPLDPIAGAAAAIDAAEPTPVSTAAATTASASAATGASVSSLSKPYIQIGTFGVETNANSAANKIRRNGMPAEVRELTSNGKKVWRVLIGPATTRSERNAMQRDAKDLGFGDAFTVKN
ncbi:SPOR domain-containing protein [Ruegeria atlantica]|uniref:SPOR domain-containing protein n=1 Tax=Ruegeria atlantica TaxID=81569 RepID=UPI00147A792C|nr:SPOR domain-containing protein [Ruegeria atlantica]